MSECGLACLAMIANSFGHRFDLSGMRRRFPGSSNGLTFKNLVHYSSEIGLHAQAMKVPLDKLEFVQLPAILHWDNRHYVVLEKATKRSVTILDPARGRVKMPRKELSKHTNGVLLEFSKRPEFEKQNDKEKVDIRSLFAGARGLGRTLAQIIALTLVIQVLTIISPLYLQVVIDRAVVNSDRQLLLVLTIAFAAFAFLNSLSEYVRNWVILVLSQTLSFQMISNVVGHLLRVRTKFFESRHIGDILSRMSSLQPIRQAFTQTSISVVVDGFLSISLLIIMLSYNLKLTFVVIFTTAFIAVTSQVVVFFLRKRQSEQLIASANEQTHVLETIRSTRAIKLFGREIERESGWRNLYSILLSSNIRLGNLQYLTTFTLSATMAIQSILIVYLGAGLVMDNTFTIGMLFAFMAYQANFANRTTSLIDGLLEFGLLKVHFSRLGDIVNEDREDVVGGAMNVSALEQLELRNVSFQYELDGRYIVKSLNLTIRNGEFVAIVGPSGEGKSTLLKLILGFLQTDAGDIIVNGRPLQDYGLRNWRRLFGVVMQDDQLISGTIAENIAFYDTDADPEAIRQAAEKSGLAQDVESMKMKYDSLIGDMGSTLSGGQRQRLLIARALYKSPNILVMDEGTANLDVASEIAIADFVSDLKITRIVVAHKPELISRADTVYELRDGVLHLLKPMSVNT